MGSCPPRPAPAPPAPAPPPPPRPVNCPSAEGMRGQTEPTARGRESTVAGSPSRRGDRPRAALGLPVEVQLHPLRHRAGLAGQDVARLRLLRLQRVVAVHPHLARD